MVQQSAFYLLEICLNWWDWDNICVKFDSQWVNDRHRCSTRFYAWKSKRVFGIEYFLEESRFVYFEHWSDGLINMFYLKEAALKPLCYLRVEGILKINARYGKWLICEDELILRRELKLEFSFSSSSIIDQNNPILIINSYENIYLFLWDWWTCRLDS